MKDKSKKNDCVVDKSLGSYHRLPLFPALALPGFLAVKNARRWLRPTTSNTGAQDQECTEEEDTELGVPGPRGVVIFWWDACVGLQAFQPRLVL